jgi:alkaline phosphatase
MFSLRIMPRSRSWILSAALAALTLPFYSGCSPKPSFKHVILFIGDGMSVESEIAASRYLYGKDRALAWHSLPAQSYVSTWDVTAYDSNARKAHRAPYSDAVFAPSLGYDVREEGGRPYPDEGPLDKPRPVSKPATDSASAATALATGIKTSNGNIAWRPGDKPWGGLPTIAEEFRGRRGGAIGIVTTVPFSHATPAAFVSHNTSRGHYYTGYKDYAGLGIADEIILRVKPDVVIGGGNPAFDNPGFDTRKGYISEALYKTLQASTEYVLAERQAGAEGARTLNEAAEKALAQGKKLFGLFGGEGGNFALPVPENSPGSPQLIRETSEDLSLRDATLAALRVLGKDPDGFFLMAEQGDIDWANHDNDFRGLIGAMSDLEDAVRAALAFVDEPGDDIDWTNTVLLVTADHATGGLRLDPARPLGAGQLPLQLARAKAEEAAAKPANGNGRHPTPAAPAVFIFKSPYIYPDGEVSYSSIGHTNELVTLAVSGSAGPLFLEYKGWWYPGPIIDNTQVNAAMREALGLGALQAVAVSNGVTTGAPGPSGRASRK